MNERTTLATIEGLNEPYRRLLGRCGVENAEQLQSSDPRRLADQMLQVNASLRLTHLVPSEAVIAGWVEQARRIQQDRQAR